MRPKKWIGKFRGTPARTCAHLSWGGLGDDDDDGDGDGNGNGRRPDAIVRRQIGGTTETVYTEADDPLVHIFVSPLVTGP